MNAPVLQQNKGECRPMKVAVIGANGQLGRDVSREFIANGDEVRELSHSDIEICSLESVVTKALAELLKPQNYRKY